MRIHLFVFLTNNPHIACDISIRSCLTIIRIYSSFSFSLKFIASNIHRHTIVIVCLRLTEDGIHSFCFWCVCFFGILYSRCITFFIHLISLICNIWTDNTILRKLLIESSSTIPSYKLIIISFIWFCIVNITPFCFIAIICLYISICSTSYSKSWRIRSLLIDCYPTTISDIVIISIFQNVTSSIDQNYFCMSVVIIYGLLFENCIVSGRCRRTFRFTLGCNSSMILGSASSTIIQNRGSCGCS